MLSQKNTPDPYCQLLELTSKIKKIQTHPFSVWSPSHQQEIWKEFPSSGSWASLVAQEVKNLPAIQETWVRSLSWEDPLEEGMATHSSSLAWRIPWTEEPGGLQSMRSQSQTQHSHQAHLRIPVPSFYFTRQLGAYLPPCRKEHL